MNMHQTSVYPQAQPFAGDEVEPFLARPLIAKLCTHNEDGTIHIVPIWFKYQNGEFILGTQQVSRKVKNIEHDNRISLLVDTHEPTLQAVIVQGVAKLDYDDVIPKRVAIFEKYIGAEDAPELAERLADSFVPVIIRIRPEHMISFDYSKGFGLSGDLDAEMSNLL